MDILFDKLFINSIILDILENTNIRINAPVINDMYIENSGLYCLNIIIKINPISPIPYYLYDIHKFLQFL